MMDEFKGTPGPWAWYQPQSTPSMNPYSAAFVLGPKRVPMDRSEGFTAADAKIIAAAPDLLEALQACSKELRAMIDFHNVQNPDDGSYLYDYQTVAEADEAIAKVLTP